MAITRTAMVDDDGSGTTGTIINNAWKTELYNQIDAADAAIVPPSSAWVNAPFSAGTFTTDVGSWTVPLGNVATFAYAIVGKTMIFAIYILGTTPGGSPNHLRIALPTAVTYSGLQTGTAFWHTNNGLGIAGQGLANPPTLYLLRDGPWLSAATTLMGTFMVPLA